MTVKRFGNIMEFCNILWRINNIEIVYRDYWKNAITKKIYFPSNLEIPSHPNYYVLKKLENIMKQSYKNLNFGIKDTIKSASETKKKSCWSKICQGLHYT